jgi:hypothetical protein
VSEAASTLILTEPDVRPSFPSAALAAELLETCAGGAAIGAAIEFGVVERAVQGPFDPAEVAGEANDPLLGRVAEALRPGGRVAVIDILANECKVGARGTALYALGLLLRTARGGIYPYLTLRRWQTEGGFAEVRRRLPGPLSLSLITARR